jgi:hypothetical protein
LGSYTVQGGFTWTNHEDWDLASGVVSDDKVRWAIDGFGIFKATGEDEIYTGCSTHSSQYAYQKGRSTEVALHDLVQKIKRSLNQIKFVLGVFLDIDRAFDIASFGSMHVASMGFVKPCVYGLMPCFAVEAFE